MFSQLLIVRVRAAEKALREGRLDEAFRLAMAPDLREHKRGKAVLSALGEKFLERAREHYRADRFSEALIDLDRADAGAGTGESELKNQVAELRKFVQTVAAETNRNDNSRRRRLDEAVRRIEDGSLAAGKRILEEASSADGAAAKVREVAERRQAEVREVLAQAEAALAAEQFAAAADRVQRAKALDAHAVDVVRVEAELCGRVIHNARAALAEGKIERAASELACLGDVGRTLPARREATDLLACAKDIARSIADGRYGDATRLAMNLGRMMPEAKWVKATIEQVRQMEELRAQLASGPLAQEANGGHGPPYEKTPLVPPLVRGEAGISRAAGRGAMDETVAVPRSDAARRNDGLGPIQPAARGSEKLLLLVDGGGSFLLVRGSAASVGRAAADHPADVPIFSDLAERHMNVSRVDDDYFAFASKEIEVRGNPTLHTLLRDGDRVVLGRKAKFTFRLPSRRSATAVLELSDTTKMPNDVRRVILFDRAATIGFGPTAHIPCRHAGGPIVLYERHGTFWVRRQDDGHVDTAAKELAIGETVEMGGVSMVIRPWTMKA